MTTAHVYDIIFILVKAIFGISLLPFQPKQYLFLIEILEQKKNKKKSSFVIKQYRMLCVCRRITKIEIEKESIHDGMIVTK